MSKAYRFVGVTFGELAAWHASGETKLLRGRLVDVPQDSDSSGLPVRHGYAVRMLLRRLPPLSLDDEEGILIVRLASGQLPGDDEDLQLVSIPMERVEVVVPLTARARGILIGRLEPYGIAPGEAWFEDEFQRLSYERRVESSIRAGSKLVGIFAPGVRYLPTDKLKDSAALALAMKDFDGAVPGSAELASAPETWVQHAFGWTRHKPYDRGALNHLYDAGTVLRKLLPEEPVAERRKDALTGFRDSAKSMVDKLGNRAHIDEILGQEEFVSVAQELEAANPDLFPSGLRALVLYLRWQEQFHNADSSIDIGSLSADLHRLAPSIDNREDILAALWLLGFYAGCERVAPLAYAANSNSHSWFRGQPLEVERLHFGNVLVGGTTPDELHTREAQLPVTAKAAVLNSDVDDGDADNEPTPTEAGPQSGLGVAEDGQPNAGSERGSQSATDVSDNVGSEKPHKSPADERGSTADADAAKDDWVGTNKNETVAAEGSSGNGQARIRDNDDKPHESVETSRSNSDLFGADEKYGKPPWDVKLRQNADAIQMALAQARQRDPHLTGRGLYEVIAKDWFGYEKIMSKYLEYIKSIDQSSNPNT